MKLYFLKDPSLQVPKRKRTAHNTKKGKQKSKADEEKRLITKKAIYCQGQIAWKGHWQLVYRALVDTEGQPTIGDKSAMTSTLFSRYKSVIKSDYPPSV